MEKLPIKRNGNYEKVIHKNLEISLLASGDGTEVIHHKLLPGGHWGLSPQEGWNGLEHFYLIKGRLKSVNSDIVINVGDSMSFYPVDQYIMFTTDVETEFIYVTSKPIFHQYSKVVKELMNLAVSVEEKDGYTSEHCNRIKEISMMIGEKLNLDYYQLYLLNLSSFLHDIGKVKIPLSILNKTGKLTNQEWEIMKLHTTYGRQILEETNLPFLKEVGKIVEQHHERYDGKGYPYGLKGDEISLLASIIAVSDSFDAMTTDRVYQKKRSKEDAIKEIIACNGTRYNPKVVEAFLQIKDKLLT